MVMDALKHLLVFALILVMIGTTEGILFWLVVFVVVELMQDLNLAASHQHFQASCLQLYPALHQVSNQL